MFHKNIFFKIGIYCLNLFCIELKTILKLKTDVPMNPLGISIKFSIEINETETI